LNLQYRRVAADVLILFGPSAATATPALLRAAREPDEGLRRTAVTTLGAIRSPAALEPLIDILIFDESPAVQDAAAVSISQIGAAAVARLRSLLDDADPATQLRSADALRRIGPPARNAAPRLTELLKSDDISVGVAAAEALWGITGTLDPALETAVASLAAPQREVRMRAHRLILTIGRSTRDPVVLSRLETAAESRNPLVRQAAFIALRELQKE
jgi:HEAT repeat protein